MDRVRRTRPPIVVESAPQRIRRVRQVAEVAVQPTRIRRVRSAPVAPGDKPRFIIDWDRGLGWKLQVYLITSFLYYNQCKSVITDHEFDRLCKELAEGWDTFEHQHKHCTSKEDMVAGTGYANDYPLMVQASADMVSRTFELI